MPHETTSARDDAHAVYEQQFGQLMELAVVDGVTNYDAERLVHDVLLASIRHLATLPNPQQHLRGAMLAALRHEGARR